ncbi:hypothetical protein NUACC21_36290 [Scytonema sp. NUACC21]
MTRPVGCHTDGYRGYLQALDDFGITQLLAQLRNCHNSARIHLEQRELESVAAMLIAGLTEGINSHLIAKYFHAIRQGSRDIIPGGIKLKFPSRIDLPPGFPDTAHTPRFLFGERLRWRTDASNTDWGIAIGRFYTFAPHRCCWMWCYLIWLSKDSPSAAWTVTDTAWEDDLEPMTAKT